MSDNEFVVRQQREQMNSMQNTIVLIGETMKKLEERMSELKEEVHQTREDLRNLDKLRALRK